MSVPETGYQKKRGLIPTECTRPLAPSHMVSISLILKNLGLLKFLLKKLLTGSALAYNSPREYSPVFLLYTRILSHHEVPYSPLFSPREYSPVAKSLILDSSLRENTLPLVLHSTGIFSRYEVPYPPLFSPRKYSPVHISLHGNILPSSPPREYSPIANSNSHNHRDGTRRLQQNTHNQKWV